jgi:hypothetical protein
VLRYNQPQSDECGPTPLRVRGYLGCGASLSFAACAGVNGEAPCVTMSSDQLEYIDASGTLWSGGATIASVDYGFDVPMVVIVEGRLASQGRAPLLFSVRLVACDSVARLPC